MRYIEITVEESGELKIDAIGYKGQGCEKAVAEVCQIIGAKTVSKTRKPEYYQQASNKQQAGQR